MILLDTSGLLAALVADEPRHSQARAALAAEPPPRILPPFVLAELDYLLGSRRGAPAQMAALEDVENRTYELAAFETGDIALARGILERYRDLTIGLADASIVVLAERYRTNRVLTLDERQFRAVRTPAGEPFTILPADA